MKEKRKLDTTGQKPIEMMSISRKRYEELLRAEEELEALEAAGVNNWEWYGEAIATLMHERSVADGTVWSPEDGELE